MNNDLSSVSCPYFGLQPATENEAMYFFGRKSDRQIIKMNLYGQPLTVLYGASGVGKSSLLLAGVVPQLRRPKQAVVVFRQYQEGNIADSLKRAVLEAVRQSTQGDPNIDLSLPLDEFLLSCNHAVGGAIFLIFDQFESYFLHHPPSVEADRFEAQFATIINRADIDVHLLLALRDDMVSNLDRFRRRINSFQNMLRVEYMTRAAAEEAIRKPLDKYNESQEPSHRVSIEDELVRALLDDVSRGQDAFGANGSQNGECVETPSLQLALAALWNEEMAAASRVLRLETYQRLGRAERIVRTYLDRILAEFGEANRQLAAHMFGYLVTPTGTRLAQTAQDLATYTEARVEDVERVLSMLCAPGVRVLHAVAGLPGQPEMTRYEIIHDVLGPAIIEWHRRYREEEARRKTLIREAALRQVERAKRLRRTVILMGVAIAALAGLTIYAFQQRRHAHIAEGQAVKARNEALGARDQVEREKLRAETALSETEKAEARERTAKEEALGQAANAKEAKGVAENALRRAEAANAEAERQKNIAIAARQRAERSKQTALEALAREKEARQLAMIAEALAKKNAEEAREQTKRAEEETKKAQIQEKKAVAAGKEAEDARKEAADSINRIKEIDKSAPFSGGVIRNPVAVLNAVFSPDLSSIITSDSSGHVLFWKTKDVTNLPQDKLTATSEQSVLNLPLAGGLPLITALSSDGGLAAIAQAGTVYVWEPKASSRSSSTEQRVRSLKMPVNSFGEVSTLAVISTRDGRFVAAGSKSGLVAVWNLDECDEGGCRLVTKQAHYETVNSIAFSPDGRFIASGAGPSNDDERNDCKLIPSKDNTAKIWAVSWNRGGETLAEIKTLEGHQCRVNSVAFNDPERNPKKTLRVVTTSEDGTAKTWNVLRITSPPNGVATWKVIDANTYTLNVYEAPRVRPWLFRQPMRQLFGIAFGLKGIEKVQVPIYTAAFSPVDDNIIVTSGEEGALRVWDVPSSSTVRIIQGHYGSVRNVAFSAGGQYVVTAGDDGTVRLWNMCEAGDKNNARRSVIANLTTKEARANLAAYCGNKVGDEKLPK